MNSEQDGNKSIASMIYWQDGVEKERIERWIQKLIDQGYAVSHTTQEYNPNWGTPISYIP